MHHVDCCNMFASVYVSNKLCRKDGVGLKARTEEQKEEYVIHIYIHVYTHIYHVVCEYICLRLCMYLRNCAGRRGGSQSSKNRGAGRWASKLGGLPTCAARESRQFAPGRRDKTQVKLLKSLCTATLCNTQPYTATHCNTPQHTATHCNTPQHAARTSRKSTRC